MNRAGRVQGAVDVSGHPSVEELMVAADILVLDYSSIFFDFALTGKPAATYVPDLAYHRDVERGLYGDRPLEPELCPSLSTTTGSHPGCSGASAASTPLRGAARRRRPIRHRSWTTSRGSVNGLLVSWTDRRQEERMSHISQKIGKKNCDENVRGSGGRGRPLCESWR